MTDTMQRHAQIARKAIFYSGLSGVIVLLVLALFVFLNPAYESGFEQMGAVLVASGLFIASFFVGYPASILIAWVVFLPFYHFYLHRSKQMVRLFGFLGLIVGVLVGAIVHFWVSFVAIGFVVFGVWGMLGGVIFATVMRTE